MNEIVKEIKNLVNDLNRAIRKERQENAESLVKVMNETATDPEMKR